MKGVRKRRETRSTGLRIGRYVLPSQIMITGLLVLLYAWLLLGGAYERDSILTQLVFFALFLGVLYLLVTMQKIYARIGLAFLALAIPPLCWNVALSLGYWPAVLPGPMWLICAGLVALVLGAGPVIVLLYYEKAKPASVFARAGDLKAGLLQGSVMLIASAVLAVAAAYAFFDAGSADMARLLPAFGALAVFAVACGFAEELMFRGLLLSRLLPLVEKTPAIIAQAIAFAVYEAAFLYLLTSNPVYSAIIFVIAALLGAVWAWMTLRHKSIVAPALSHAGIYLILALPVFASLL